ncbi:MAG: T9SS type A sorting domain-containing protein [Saprospiraceae bacterium]|nr:T9SS type A sorting domain-containing protein [Saprospiraceae bacterium]
MKNSLTFLLLWLSIILTAQQQPGTINVNVEDGCGNAFDKPVTIDLYQIIGSNATKLTSSNIHPATFDNLDPGYTYEVRISSSDVSKTDVSIKDAYAMRNIILGIFNNLTYQPSILAGDVNSTNGITTLDIVFLTRYLVQIPNPQVSYDEWFFVDQKHLNSLDVSLKNRTIIQGIPNGLQEITFNGYQHGAVASTIPELCASCTEDSTSTKAIQIPNINVTAGQQVKFVIGYLYDAQDIGACFSLKYRDGVVSAVSAIAGTVTNFIDSTATINIAKVFDSNTPPILDFAQITFTPTKSGKLTDFFSLNDQYKNELVYKVGNCLKTYQKMSINAANLCPVTWPADTTIPDCTSNHNTGSPIIDPACVNIVFVSHSDEVLIPCLKILRIWKALNWLTGEINTHFQIIRIDSDLSLSCHGNVNVLAQDSFIISTVDLIKNGNLSHQFSFSATDSLQKTLKLYNSPPYTFDVTVYDLTDNTSCISKVNMVKNGCYDPVNIIPEISVNETNGAYVVKGSMFDGGNEYHCLGVIGEFQINWQQGTHFYDQLTFNYNQYKGTQLKINIKYKINGNFVDQRQVKINFLTDSPPTPFEIACYDDPVVKNELFEVSFFSSTFNNIYALQAAIRLKDAILVSTEKKALKDIYFNEQLHSLRYSWYLRTVEPLTLSSTDTLFTITIRPTESGNLANILSIADDLMPSEAVLNDFEQTKVDLVFRFLRRPTNTQNLTTNDFKLYPNPTSTGAFTIESNGIADGTISIYNDNGQEVAFSKQESVDGVFEVSMPDAIQNGVYMVRLTTEKTVTNKKMILMR